MNKYDLLKNTERLPPISQPARQLTNIKLSELVPFDKQPFKPYTDEKLEELAQSISDNGLLSPILVRPYGGKYQIIAGHNRVLACRLLGHNEISAVTLNLDDDSAAVALVEDNLNARLEFAHSEKALAYKLEYDAKRRQGNRLMQLRVHRTQSCRTSELLSKDATDGEKRIRQYVQIAELCDEGLEMLDACKLPFLSAYNLSYLPSGIQSLVFSVFSGKIIDVGLSEKIRNLGDGATLESISKLVNNPPVTAVATVKTVKIKFKEIKSYFTRGEDEQQIAEIIKKALAKYFGGDEA